jgi:tRNA uridine 5-carboxymethylaminomethyl modification enzyme
MGEATDDVLAAVEVELKYEGYVFRERQRAERLREHANYKLDNDLPYLGFITVSAEAREKLQRIRPETLAQAGRIAGVSPADLQNLLLEVRRLRASPRVQGLSAPPE